MPTGYTADVQSGKITEFPEFALRCARAFGALITMRDDPMDAPLPEKIEPATSYHEEHLKAANERLAALRSMSPTKADREAEKAHGKLLKAHEEYQAEKRQQKARYEAMLAKVREWSPPTKDHIELKTFMTTQLRESIDFDCSSTGQAPKRQTGAEWLAAEIASAEWDAQYHSKERAKEIERANGRTEWLDQLRKSLAA